jgi:hypothetical protein
VENIGDRKEICSEANAYKVQIPLKINVHLVAAEYIRLLQDGH